MGHTRLGTIPKTRKWVDVVQTLTNSNALGQPILASENIGEISLKILDATQDYLKAATNDLGLQYTFYLLIRVALASRDPNWLNKLNELEIHLQKDDSLLELTSEFQNRIDNYLLENHYSSDISEMAQQAAGETIASLAATKSVTLFGAGSDELRLAIKDLSSKNGFSRLSQKFFGTFMSRFINFHLSRVTAAQLGNPNLPHIDEISRFNTALQSHCEQSAKIVHDFSGEWYSKTEFQQGINLKNTSGFLAIALRKLQAELNLQEGEL